MQGLGDAKPEACSNSVEVTGWMAGIATPRLNRGVVRNGRESFQPVSAETGTPISKSSRSPLRVPQFVTTFLLYASQPDHLIGLGRFVTASFALFAVYIDPTRPITNIDETYDILAAYAAYALALLLVGRNRPLGDPRHLITHALDILVLGLLALVTEELDSPFFAFFTFAMISATIRWGWRGVGVTALIQQVLLLLVGWQDLADGDSELNIFIIRSAFCWVAAAMLGYFGTYRDRSRRQLTKLAAWPLECSLTESSPWLAYSLAHAREVLGAAYIVVVWQEVDTSSAHLAYCGEEGCQLLDEMGISGICDELLAQTPSRAGAEQDNYLLENLKSVFETLPKAFQGHQGEWRRLCTAGFVGLKYSGRVFVLNPPPQSDDMASLTEIVAARISSELERMALMNEAAAAASLDARARLARDLHDSVLQDLTAAALQIRSAERTAPAEMRPRLDDLRALLLSQQRRIREFVTQSRPMGEGGLRPLAEHLDGFAMKLGKQWGCKVDVDVHPRSLVIPGQEAAEICLLVSEATANAVRHGQATYVKIQALERGEGIELSIEDNGRGAGKDMAPDIPYSLGERVKALGGLVAAQSLATGFALSIRLPLAARQAP